MAHQDNDQKTSNPLWRYWLAAILGSALLLFTVILPAEYGIDPLRVGKLLGISGMSSAASLVSNSEDSARELIRHTTSFTLEPFESLEVKYEMQERGTLLYSWESSQTELLYELHSEPLDAEPGYADSYERARSTARSGLYQAEYDGIHGWFFENRGLATTEVSLTASGFFSKIYLYRDDAKEELAMDEDATLY